MDPLGLVGVILTVVGILVTLFVTTKKRQKRYENSLKVRVRGDIVNSNLAGGDVKNVNTGTAGEASKTAK